MAYLLSVRSIAHHVVCAYCPFCAALCCTLRGGGSRTVWYVEEIISSGCVFCLPVLSVVVHDTLPVRSTHCTVLPVVRQAINTDVGGSAALGEEC